MDKQDYEITLEIIADLVSLYPEEAGFDIKPFLERRTLVFRLVEKSSDEAVKGLENAEADILSMLEANFTVEGVNDLLARAEDAFDELNYELTVELTDRISMLRDAAFESDSLIKNIQNEVDKAKERWLEIEETETNLILALKAFDRGDYETALSRAKDAQLTLILETKGKLDMLWVLVNYWWLIIISLAVLAIVLFVTYKNSYIFVINQKLKNLIKEEKSINSLTEEAQTTYLTKGDFSPERYKEAVLQYENRLTEIKQMRVKLRNKRVSILRTEQEIENLEKEKKELKEMMIKTQKDYFKKGDLTERKFKKMHTLQKERLSELDEEKIILEEKHEQEKNTKKYKALKFLNDVINKVKKYFAGKRKNE